MSTNITSGRSAVSKEQISRLRAQLDQHRQKLEKFSISQIEPGFIDAAKELLDFMHTYEDEATYAAFEKSADFADYQNFFSPRVLRFAWAMEDLTYDEMISQRLSGQQKLGDILGPNSWDAYSRMEDVLRLVDFSPCKKYVIVGCGKVPASLFYLHDWTDVPCLVGIDNNQEAVERAKKMVDHFDLKRISIEHADGGDFDYSDFDIIYWGPFASPRMKIMEKIMASARRDSLIILRDPFFTGTLANEGVLASLDPRFEICAESGAHPGRFMLKHYLLRLK